MPSPKEERRKYKRINKSFILTYYDKSNPQEKYEITQLRNIGMGGMCFVTTRTFPSGTHLFIDLKTPYLTDITHIHGSVQESHEKVKDMLYETRLKFEHLNAEAEYVIAKLMEVFLEGEPAEQ